MWVKCHNCNGTGFEPHQTTIINQDGSYTYKKICHTCNLFYLVDRIDNVLIGYLYVDDEYDVFIEPDEPGL